MVCRSATVVVAANSQAGEEQQSRLSRAVRQVTQTAHRVDGNCGPAFRRWRRSIIHELVMCRACLSVLAGMIFAATLLAQSSAPAPVIYAESFRQGATHITEESFETKLTPENATYRELIKDSRGGDRYELTVTPYVPEGDNKVTAWVVKLRDLRHVIYSNILLAGQELSSDAKNNLWRLDPNRLRSGADSRKTDHEGGRILCGDPSEGSSLHAARFAISGFDGGGICISQ